MVGIHWQCCTNTSGVVMPIIDTNRIRHMDMSHDTDFRSDVKFDLVGCSGLEAIKSNWQAI